MQQMRAPVAAALLSALALAAVPPTAWADTCTVAETPLNFGTVFETPVATTGTVEVSCNGGGASNPFTATLSTGSGTFANRTMTRGANSLSYNIYLDAAHTRIWGDGTSGTSIVTGNFDLTGNGSQTFDGPVYGLVPAQVLPPPGQYIDTLVVTLSF